MSSPRLPVSFCRRVARVPPFSTPASSIGCIASQSSPCALTYSRAAASPSRVRLLNTSHTASGIGGQLGRLGPLVQHDVDPEGAQVGRQVGLIVGADLMHPVVHRQHVHAADRAVLAHHDVGRGDMGMQLHVAGDLRVARRSGSASSWCRPPRCAGSRWWAGPCSGRS